MERNVQRSVFPTTQLKGLYVVLIFMPHLDNTAVVLKSTGLIARSAAMDIDIPKDKTCDAVELKPMI